MAIVLAGVAAATFGVADFLGGTAARRAPFAAVALWAQLAGLLGLLLLVLFLPAALSVPALGWGLAAGLAGGIGVPLIYRGLAEGPMNVVAPLAALMSAAVPVLVGALLGDRPSLLAWLGIGLAGLAGALVAMAMSTDTDTDTATATDTATGTGAAGVDTGAEATARAARRVRGALLALFAGVCFGGFFAMLAQAPVEAGLWPVISARVSGSLAALVGVGAAVWTGSRRGRSGGQSLGEGRLGGQGLSGAGLGALGWRLAIGCGVLDASANALYLVAAQQGQLAVVGAIVALYPASTVLLAKVLHGERIGRVQRLGLALAVPALVLVTAF